MRLRSASSEWTGCSCAPNARALWRASADWKAFTTNTTALCVILITKRCLTTTSRFHSQSTQRSGRSYSIIQSASAWDLLFKVNGSPDGRLPDGAPLTDLRAATMKAVTYLPPGETTRIDLEAAEGIIFGVSLEGRAAILYPIEGPPATK